MKKKYKKYNYKNDFLKNGVMVARGKINFLKCKKLYNSVFNTYKWGKNMFRSKNDFLKNPSFLKTNPGRYKYNLALKYDLSFIEKNKNLEKILKEVVGPKYEIILKKFVVAVPERWVPTWLKKRIKKQLIPNLGNYLLPEFRECTYFRGIDFHMDQIDHKNDSSRYITLYIYLNPVSKNMSPLNMIEKSYLNGAKKFPHNVKKYKKNHVKVYGRILKNRLLVGNAGDFFIWSGLNLHGTQPNLYENPRISLRYTIKQKRGLKNKTLLNQLYKNIKGNIGMKKIRDDINEKTFEQKKFNKVLR